MDDDVEKAIDQLLGVEVPDPEAVVRKVSDFNQAIGYAQSSIEALKGQRKALLEDFFADAKHPRELMGRATWLAEQLHIPPSQVLAWLGEQVNRGDTTIVNEEDEQVGVLYIADIFQVGQKGQWESVSDTKVVWHISTDPLMDENGGYNSPAPPWDQPHHSER